MAKAILKPFEVSERDLMGLDAKQLVSLIKRLVQSDLQLAGVSQSAATGTLQITVSDGGEDVRVEWRGGPDRTDYIPRRFTVFQAKAENLSNTKLASEPLTTAKNLKPALKEVVRQKGGYIVATNKTNVLTPSKAQKGSKRKTIKTRIAELREILRKTITSKAATAEHCEIDVYGYPKLADWVNHHPMVAIWVKQLMGTASSDFDFQTLDAWAKYEEIGARLASSDVLMRNAEAIQEKLALPRQVIRLLGHSGLGKSRLVFEALRSSAANPATDLAPLVAYAREYTSTLRNQIRDFIANGQRVIVVVDECPPEDHRRLSEEVRRTDSKLSLVTMDFSFEPPGRDDLELTLERSDPAIIKEILLGAGFKGTPDDLARATEFCSGFPQVAVLVGNAVRDGAQHFADYGEKERIVGRLVWGRDTPDPDLLRCLRCLALFDAVGLDEPKANEFAWIAQRLLGMPPADLELKLERLFNRRILQKRGYSLLVVPKPLAAQLAAMQWDTATNAQRAALMSGSMPAALQTALCERLSDIDYLPNAQAITAQLCGKSGPFGSAKALNTEFGARCLRKLAEVAPREVADTIVREFGDWSVEQLRADLKPGRRNLVWALDTLIWEPSVFFDASHMLLKLAAGENETWSNNATGEFVQRFRVQLPGTSASLQSRLEALKSFVTGADAAQAGILVTALGDAIDARGHSRTVGSEYHGTRKTYADYRPAIWGEVFEYVSGCLLLLENIAEKFPELEGSVRSALTSLAPQLVLGDSVFPNYARLVKKLRPKQEAWSNLLEMLARTLRSESNDKRDLAVKQRVRKLYDEMMPNTLEERVVFFTTSVPWHFEEPDEPEDESCEGNKKRAASLGAELALVPEAFPRVVDRLSRGEARETFAFGLSYYQNVADKTASFEIAYKALVRADGHNPNPSLLGGFFQGVAEHSPTLFQTQLVRVRDEAALRQFLVYFACIALAPGGLELIIRGLAEGKIEPRAAYLLGMGRVLEPMAPALIVRLSETLRSKGADGIFVALDLLGMYTHSSADRFYAVSDEILAALKTDIAIVDKPERQMDSHHYETLAKRMLKSKTHGKAFARHLTSAILKSRKRGDTDYRLVRHLVVALLQTYPEVVLPIFAKEVERSTPRDRWYLSDTLGSPFSFDGKNDGALFTLSPEVIIAMCKKYPKRFAPMVAEIAPLFGPSNAAWSPLGVALLNEFGNRKDILDAVTSNIGTGGWSGLPSLHLKTFLAPLEAASTHANGNVRAWAKAMKRSIAAQIQREIKDEEEASIRNG